MKGSKERYLLGQNTTHTFLGIPLSSYKTALKPVKWLKKTMKNEIELDKVDYSENLHVVFVLINSVLLNLLCVWVLF